MDIGYAINGFVAREVGIGLRKLRKVSVRFTVFLGSLAPQTFNF